MRRVGHLQNLAWSIQVFSDCSLTEQSACRSQKESMYVCRWLREGILPLLLRTASLTGWSGRWGHCNKANTQAHTHTQFSMVVMSLLLFPASTLPSFQDLPSPSFPCSLALLTLASCFPLNLSLHGSPTPPLPLLSDCMVILTCSH